MRSFDADLPVMDSAIATITEDGPIYRGVNCIELAETDTLEHAATLLWDVTGVDPFSQDNCPLVSAEMRAVAAAARDAAPIDRTIAVLALAASADPRAFTRAADGRALVGGRILRLVVATMLNGTSSAEPLHLRIARTWAPANKHAADLIRRALVLLADHELNASTFTVRCAASTGLNLYDSMIAGLVALKGPKHGGAGVLAAQLVRTLVDGDVAPVIRERVALGERFAGFGHGVYKLGDPRAHALLDALARAGASAKLAREIPERIAEATGEFVNIDYALAVLVHTLGLPPGNELVLFAMARTVGWIAHACEQLRHGGLIRPRARYIGARARAKCGFQQALSRLSTGSNPLGILARGGGCRLDHASTIEAADRPDRQRQDQRTANDQRHPVMFGGAAEAQPSAVAFQRRHGKDARQHMRGRPEQDRRGIDGVEAQRRHAERARRDRHEGAYRRHEAGKEHRQRAPAMKERLALRYHARVICHRPRIEDFALGAVSDPERRSIAEQGTGDRRRQHPFKPQLAAGHQRAQRKDDGRAWNQRTCNGNGFQQGCEE